MGEQTPEYRRFYSIVRHIFSASAFYSPYD
jgi:hypothetical protein